MVWGALPDRRDLPCEAYDPWPETLARTPLRRGVQEIWGRQNSRERMRGASETPLRQEEDDMRRATLSMLCLAAMLCLGLAAPVAMAMDEPPANATVSFGEWQTDPPLDRFPNNSRQTGTSTD